MHPIRLALASSLLLGLLPVGVAAQDWGEPWSDPRDQPGRVDVSVTGGWLAPTDWSDLVVLGTLSPITGSLQQLLVRDVRVEPAAAIGVEVTYWRDRYGFRVHGARARSALVVGGASLGPGSGPFSTHVDTWVYDVRGAIGLVAYSPERRAWPYVFLGLGGITYDLEQTVTPPLLTFIEGGRTPPVGPGGILIVEDDGREVLIAIDELAFETVLAFSFGAGADLRLPFGGGALGVRLEVSDHVAASPLRLRVRELSPVGGLTASEVVDFGAVHHLRATAALVIQIGR